MEQAAEPASSILSPHIGEASDIAYSGRDFASDESKFVLDEISHAV